MAGMLLIGGHGAGVSPAGHAHPHADGRSPHLVLVAASLIYVGWTAVALAHPRHRPASWAGRVELTAMGAVFLLLVAAMTLG